MKEILNAILIASLIAISIMAMSAIDYKCHIKYSVQVTEKN